MGPIHDLRNLILQLDHVHSSEFSWESDYEFPDFVTAENGLQRHFDKVTRTHLHNLAKDIFSKINTSNFNIEYENFQKIFKQVVANLHASKSFNNYQDGDFEKTIALIIDGLETIFSNSHQEFTHYFPAWTLGMERSAPFSLGPVTFLSREDFIDSINLHPRLFLQYNEYADKNQNWKELLKEDLRRGRNNIPIGGIADKVYDVVIDCPSVLKVTIQNYEREFSGKLARLICRTSLDSISLIFGSADFFHQQVLHEERLPPISTNNVFEIDGLAWIQGVSLSRRLPLVSGAQAKSTLDRAPQILSAFGHILDGLTSPKSHPHPKLANRWATALDWFGEGNRELNDAIAVAKLGTCLDVLAAGGRAKGIMDLMKNLTYLEKNSEVVKGPSPITLWSLVKNIYNDGRSKILHGTHSDRLKSFSDERKHAAHLARIALIRAAICLQQYSGPDTDQAFLTMPSVR